MRNWFGGSRRAAEPDDVPDSVGNLALSRAHNLVHPHPRPQVVSGEPSTVSVRLESPARETPDDPPKPRRGFLRVAIYACLLLSLALTDALSSASAEDGSLWDTRTGYRYTNRKAMRVGDVITVRVSESSSGSNRSSLSASKEHKLAAAGGPGAGKLDFLPLFGFDSQMKNELDGSGAVSVSGQLSTTLSVTVREIRPNGHLVVEGSRLISLNGEEERVSVHGVARPEDVRSDNTVLSTQLSEVRIDYDGKGIGKSSTRPGILQRVLGWIF